MVRYLTLFTLLVALMAALPVRAAPPPLLFAVPPPEAAICDEAGKEQPAPPLAFALPAPAEAAPADEACPDRFHLLKAEAAAALLPPPPADAAYYVLYPDGHTAPLQVRGVARKGAEARVLGEAEDPGKPLGLLLLAPATVPKAPVLDTNTISGTVRRRIGRKSLAARGHFSGEGAQVAAVFKVRGPAVQIAVFGEDGGLRVYQSVPWRPGRSPRALPTAAVPILGLGGAGQDGLLLRGDAGEPEPLYLVLRFEGKTVKAITP